jgi:hypothetical protein
MEILVSQAIEPTIAVLTVHLGKGASFASQIINAGKLAAPKAGCKL